MKGSEDNIVHFEWNEEYQDFINRFESWVNPEEIKSPDDLYDRLHDWLGITKKGKSLPTQTQMDFFTEYYKQEYFDIVETEREEEGIGEAPLYEYKTGSLYNEFSHEFTYRNRKTEKYEHYMVVEREINFRLGKAVVFRDTKTGRILGWRSYKGIELGSRTT
jgi:hypothetical protein